MRVDEVDDYGAKITKLDGTGRWTMPLADYNAKFGEAFRPATEVDLAAAIPPKFKPPDNVPDDWGNMPADPMPSIGGDF